MELNRIGADLFGVAESQVLNALARLADPVSGRHLASLSGADSPSTVHRYLQRLSQIGLVDATKTPSATLYRLNRQHVFWDPIEAILAAPARIEQQIAEFVAEQLQTHARVAVFGSVAIGTSGPDSDYDVLLLVDGSVSSERREKVAAGLGQLIENLTGNAGQVIDISEGELQHLAAQNAPIVREWQEHARPIDGRGQISQLRGPS